MDPPSSLRHRHFSSTARDASPVTRQGSSFLPPHPHLRPTPISSPRLTGAIFATDTLLSESSKDSGISNLNRESFVSMNLLLETIDREREEIKALAGRRRRSGTTSLSEPEPPPPPVPPLSLSSAADTISIAETSVFDPDHHGETGGEATQRQRKNSILRAGLKLSRSLHVPSLVRSSMADTMSIAQASIFDEDGWVSVVPNSYNYGAALGTSVPPTSKRVHVLLELLSSEREYASNLTFIRDIIIPMAIGKSDPSTSIAPVARMSPILSDFSPDSSTAISLEDIKIIFSNISDLCLFSDMFCDRIEAALGSVLDGGEGEDCVGALFLDIIPSMEPNLKKYIVRYPKALRHLNKLSQDATLRTYFDRMWKIIAPLTHIQDLTSFLILPSQHLLKYIFLLHAIIGETPDSHTDRQNLISAKNKLEEMARNMNEAQRRHEVVRKFLLEGEFERVEESGKGSKLTTKLENIPFVVAASMQLGRRKNVRSFRPKEANEEAALVDSCERRLKAIHAHMEEFSRGAVEWSVATRVSIEKLRAWALGFGQVVGLSVDQESEAFGAFIAIIDEHLLPMCDDLQRAIKRTLLPALAQLVESGKSPIRLLEALHALEPLHYALLNLDIRKNRPPPATLEASQSYVALRGQLGHELPQYVALLERGTLSALGKFIIWQAEFWRDVRNKWIGLWGALSLESERIDNDEETVKAWRSRWIEVWAEVNQLNITTKLLREDPVDKLVMVDVAMTKRRRDAVPDVTTALTAHNLAHATPHAHTPTQGLTSGSSVTRQHHYGTLGGAPMVNSTEVLFIEYPDSEPSLSSPIAPQASLSHSPNTSGTPHGLGSGSSMESLCSIESGESKVDSRVPPSHTTSTSVLVDYNTTSTTFDKISLAEPHRELANSEPETQEFTRLLCVICDCRATDVEAEYGLQLLQQMTQEGLGRTDLLNLRERDARSVLGIIQNWLDVNPSHELRQKIISLLVKLAAVSQELPPSLFLEGVDLCGVRDPILMGGFADVFRGRYQEHEVAIKRLCVTSSADKAVIYPKFCREALIWRQLRNPYILPFLGVDRDNFRTSDHLCMVAIWMPNGTVRDFLKSPICDPVLHCDRLLNETASGLQYLHSQSVIHGDINDVNILVDEDCHARLADFGLTLVGESSAAGMTTTESGAGTLRWKAPEFHESEFRRSIEGDVWSFACLCYAVYTRQRPYGKISDLNAVRAIMAGQHPDRPASTDYYGPAICDLLWSLMKRCWNIVPSERPGIGEILKHFERTVVTNEPHDVNKKADIDSVSLAHPAKSVEESQPLSSLISALASNPSSDYKMSGTPKGSQHTVARNGSSSSRKKVDEQPSLPLSQGIPSPQVPSGSFPLGRMKTLPPPPPAMPGVRERLGSTIREHAKSGSNPNSGLRREKPLYTCRVVHQCEPPDGTEYLNLPFFQLHQGDILDVLREEGHPLLHPKLPLYIDAPDDFDDCLLLVRDGSGDIGWALASFLIPVDV